MLRLQEGPSGPFSFLAGHSEMARLISSRDWSQHPFGPLDQWPQSLRSALSICLQSAFPTAIYWGNELRLLYNDAWAPIPGPRHPAALGAPARQVWTDIWHEIEPQFRHLIETGEGIFVQDKMLPMARFGAPEETYWSYSFTPIRGEDGAIAGIFNSGFETTRTVLGGRQMRFLLDVGGALRATDSLDVARQHAVSELRAHLDVTGMFLLDLGSAADDCTRIVVERWATNAPGDRAADLPAVLGPILRSGADVSVGDACGSAIDPALRTCLGNSNLAGCIAVPLAGTASALVAVSERPRIWNDFERATMANVLERLAGHAERVLLAERERLIAREIDHRARNALSVTQAIVRQTLSEGGDDVRRKITERLAALARAHALLAAERWQAVDLGALVREELAPFSANNVSIDGPAIELAPQQAQTFALIVHELVTNSVKYGAVGRDQTTLSIDWHLDDAGLLTLNWSETFADVEQPAIATSGGGFGTNLIDRLISHQLRGKITRQRHDFGFHCRIELPLQT